MIALPGPIVDWDPPAALLAALADRTGTDLAQLCAVTLARWVPWLGCW